MCDVKKIAAFNNVSIYIFLPRADEFARVQAVQRTNKLFSCHV